MVNRLASVTMLGCKYPAMKKSTNIAILLFSIFLCLLGISMFVLVLNENSFSLYGKFILMLLGMVFLLWGVFESFWRSQRVVYGETKSLIKETILFFDLRYQKELKRMIEEKRMDVDIKLDNIGQDVICMNILLSKDCRFAAVQLFCPDPYICKPISSPSFFYDSETVQISKFLVKYKSGSFLS